MSRTQRRKRNGRSGKVKDGTRQSSCGHDCPYCQSNKTHGHKKREPLVE